MLHHGLLHPPMIVLEAWPGLARSPLWGAAMVHALRAD